jgi:hypothetical protein
MMALSRAAAVFFAVIAAIVASPATAQTVPCPYPFYQNQVLTAAQWNACIGIGMNALPTAGGTMTGKITLVPSNPSSAGLNMLPGGAPTSPLNGDVWTTVAGMFVRVSGVTYGPLAQSFAPEAVGAVADNSCTPASTDGTDNTVSLNAWAALTQNHLLNFTGTGCYRITGQINLPNAVIVGQAPNGVGAGGGSIFPLINFVPDNAAGGLTGNCVLNYIGNQTAIHALGILGSTTDTSYDDVCLNAKSNGIYDHSFIYGGGNGVTTEHGSGAGANVEVYDTSVVKSGLDGILSAAPNMKLSNLVASGANSDCIHYGGSQIILSGTSVVEGCGADGLNVTTADLVSVGTTYFDDCGKVTTGSCLEITESQTVSIGNNTFHRSGANQEGVTTTQSILLDGNIQSLSLSGNTYLSGNSNATVANRPDYAIEASSGTAIQGCSFMDAPTIMNNGFMGPNITAILGACSTGQPAPGSLIGLGTSSTNGTHMVTLATGSATSSLSVMKITLTSPCTVNLGANGDKGLDTGTLASASQYSFYLYQKRGGGNPSCIASASTTGPRFDLAFPPPDSSHCGNTPANAVAMTGYVTSGSPNLINLQSTSSNKIMLAIGAFQPGDYVTDCQGLLASGSQIQSFGVGNVNFIGTTSTSTNTISSVSWFGTAPQAGDLIGNSVTNAPLNKSSLPFITAIDSGCTPSPHCIVMSISSAQFATTGALVAAPQSSIVMTQNATGTATWNVPDTFYVYNDGFRRVATLSTCSATTCSGGASTNIVPYAQTGDRFDFNNFINDLVDAGLGNSDTTETLGSEIPSGLQVDWLASCVASAQTIIYAPTQSPGTPTAFTSGAPGYQVDTTAPASAWLADVMTNTSRQVHARASGSGTSLRCMTTGYKDTRGK